MINGKNNLGFRPIEQAKVSTMIVEQIRSHILKGSLAPGDALPSERELIKIFNVSRTSLREALKVLDASGYITIAQRKRTRVKSLAPDNITNPIRRLLKNDVQTVFEVIEVRRCIESWNAYYAALRATGDEVQTLWENLALMAAKMERKESHILEDATFHRTVAMMTHNRVQTQLIFSIDEMLRECVGVAYEEIETRVLLAEHTAIYLAIKERDAEQARGKMDEHLGQVKSRIKAAYDRLEKAGKPMEDS